MLLPLSIFSIFASNWPLPRLHDFLRHFQIHGAGICEVSQARLVRPHGVVHTITFRCKRNADFGRAETDFVATLDDRIVIVETCAWWRVLVQYYLAIFEYNTLHLLRDKVIIRLNLLRHQTLVLEV